VTARLTTWMAWSLFALSAAFDLGGGALLILGPDDLWARTWLWPEILTGLGMLVYALVGALVAARQPRNPIGWILCAMGLAMEGFLFMGAYVRYAPPLVYALLVALGEYGPPLLNDLWLITYGLAPLLVLLFPDGQPLSPRWQPIVWLSAAFAPLKILLDLFRPSPFLAELLEWPIVPLMWLTLMVCAVVSMALRFRRASRGTRAQLKWFAYAVVAFTVVEALLHAIQFSPRINPEILPPAALFEGIPNAVGLAAIPVAMGIAILRHHLYDIDLLINRTLVYGMLTVGLGLLYWGSVIVLQQVLRPLTQGSELAIIGSTLAIAALFQPARSRIQAAVDRRFYRRKYDATQTLAAFSATLRSEVDLDSLARELLTVVRQTLQPDRASLWLRPPHPGRALAGDLRAPNSITRAVTIPERSPATTDSA
jgi:hypothetical protein